VREHFGAELRAQQEEAWKAGHERLYEHLITVPDKHQPDTLVEMAPLFQAVHHGCQAARRQEVLDDVYDERISRKKELYLTRKLGAFGAELGLVASFFDSPFERPAADLAVSDRAWAFIAAAFALRSLGHLDEAMAPTRASLLMQVEHERWMHAAISADHLCELQLALGDITSSLATGRLAVDYADRSGNFIRRITNRTALAEVQHQKGELEAASALFREAEKIQVEGDPDYPLLYSAGGYRYCDLLLTKGEPEMAREKIDGVLKQASQHSDLNDSYDLYSIALNQLSLVRTALALGYKDEGDLQLNRAIQALRESGRIDHLPRGLLARAAFFREVEEYEKSRRDFDEVIRLATRCGMRLFECDAHLEYARLEIKQGQPDAARVHAKSAEQLVAACGYRRRDGEVAALKGELGL
jgi:hypothetical protein